MYFILRRANEKLANKLREQSETIRQLQNDKKAVGEEVQSYVHRVRQLEAINAELKTEQLKLKVLLRTLLARCGQLLLFYILSVS